MQGPLYDIEHVRPTDEEKAEGARWLEGADHNDLPWKLRILSRDSGEELAALPLPAPPARDGLSLTRNGRVLVVLENGQLMCFGE